MEIVDMVITQIRCSGPKSRSVNIFSAAGFGPKPGCWEIRFRQMSSESYTIKETHKQDSLLDTIFNHIFYFGPPGKYLYLSPQHLLHVGRRSRPRCSRFS